MRDSDTFPGLTDLAFIPRVVDKEREKKIQEALKVFYTVDANYTYGTEKFKLQFLQLLKAYDQWGKNND